MQVHDSVSDRFLLFPIDMDARDFGLHDSL